MHIKQVDLDVLVGQSTRTATKKERPLIEPQIAHRLGRIEKLGIDVSEARAAYEEYGRALRDGKTLATPAVESRALENKRYALEQLNMNIKTLRSKGGGSEVSELKERRSALAAEIDAAESDREAIRENVAGWTKTQARLRATAERLELAALEACREKLAREIEAAVLAEPLCLRFPTETPDEALRLARVADDLVEREFPLYVPRQDFFDLMAPEVAQALRLARA